MRPSGFLRVRRRAGAAALVAVCGFVLSACADDDGASSSASTLPSTVAATVGDEPISITDVDADLLAMEKNAKFVELASQERADGSFLFQKGKATKEMRRLWLGVVIQQAVINQEFAAQGAKLGKKADAESRATEFYGGQDPTIFEGFPKAFRESAVADQQRWLGLGTKLGSPAVTDDEVKQAYDGQFGAGSCPSGLSVAHILVADVASAEAVLAELATGGDFAAIARERSTDTGSGANGGELGCLLTGQFVPAFEEAALAATPGAPTAPVETEFGQHIILTSPFEAPPLAEVEEEIRAALEQQLATADPVERFLRSDEATEGITVEKAYGTFDKATLSVTAPDPSKETETPDTTAANQGERGETRERPEARNGRESTE